MKARQKGDEFEEQAFAVLKGELNGKRLSVLPQRASTFSKEALLFVRSEGRHHYRHID